MIPVNPYLIHFLQLNIVLDLYCFYFSSSCIKQDIGPKHQLEVSEKNVRYNYILLILSVVKQNYTVLCIVHLF